MEYPLVSIITVNYDHPDVTCQLLESLGRITYPNTEIIVVDNASPNDDPIIIPRRFPGIVFIRNKENMGFAGGNNAGIRKARGKYVLFLNNDTEVDPAFLDPLVFKMEQNPRIGAVSPKIRYFNQPDTIQYSGSTRMNPFTVRSHGLGYRAVDRGQFDRDAVTPFIHGAAVLVPMRVLQEVGLMAECYFLYYEELDWAARISRSGYELWYVHNSVVYHKESISTGKLSPAKVYYLNRGRLLYLRRNIHGLVFFIAILYQAFIAIPKNSLMFLVRGKNGYFNAYRKAILWHIKHIRGEEIHSNPTLTEGDPS